jgi:hypothetical protein
MEVSTTKYKKETLTEKPKKKQTNTSRTNTEAFADIVMSL